MGYLDNSTVTVDAILTNKGRQILAAGGRLNITKFALSDDEIDYTLWNPSHTLGSNYYGAVIEAMPVVEANPDEAQMMRYKLVTLPKDVLGIPVISINPGSISLTSLQESVTVTPSTLNLAGGNSALGYTAIFSDDTVGTLEVAPDGVIKGVSNSLLAGAGTTSATSFLDDEVNGMSTAGSTITRVGTKCHAVVSSYRHKMSAKFGAAPSIKKLIITELKVYSPEGEEATETADDVL